MKFHLQVYQTGWNKDWQQSNEMLWLDAHAPSKVVLRAIEHGTIRICARVKSGGRQAALPCLNGTPVAYDQSESFMVQAGKELTLEAKLEGNKDQCWNIWEVENAVIVLKNPLAVSFWKDAHLGDSLGMLIACENFAKANKITIQVRCTPLFEAITEQFAFEHLELVVEKAEMIHVHPFGHDFESLGWIGGITKAISLATGGLMPERIMLPKLRRERQTNSEKVVLCQFDGRSGGVWPKPVIEDYLTRFKHHIVEVLGGPDTRNYLGDTFKYRRGNLGFLIDQLMACERFTGTDSGIAHLACILGLKIDMLPSPSVGRKLVKGIFQHYPNPPNIDFSYQDKKSDWLPTVKKLKKVRPVNLHVLNTPNIGDRKCAPSLYFNSAGKNQDLWQAGAQGGPLIIGGGGLLHPSFTAKLASLVEQSNGPKIVWGVGTNTHGVNHQAQQAWLDSCDLIGLRDWGSGRRWVPCASCMSPEFDRDEPPKYRAVVYRHAGEADNIPDRMGLPTLTNHASNLSDVVSFLLSGEFVITNTYHGMYWATLLRRKVIVYPFSSRHFFLKHQPVFMENGRHWDQGFPAAQSYQDALAECRFANISFASDVKRLCL
jgi:hypothetical protein